MTEKSNASAPLEASPSLSARMRLPRKSMPIEALSQCLWRERTWKNKCPTACAPHDALNDKRMREPLIFSLSVTTCASACEYVKRGEAGCQENSSSATPARHPIAESPTWRRGAHGTRMSRDAPMTQAENGARPSAPEVAPMTVTHRAMSIRPSAPRRYDKPTSP